MKTSAALLMLAVAILSGCSAAPRPAPGMASVRVNVLAEPKAGRKVTATPVLTYDTPAVAHNEGDFALVDYANLDNIVIWLEPADAPNVRGPERAPVRLDVNAKHPAAGVSKAVCVGQKIILRNSGSNAQTIYSVSDGNDFDLGSVAPGQESAYVVKNPGLIEVLTESSKDPVVSLYAAPTSWVALTHSEGTVDFTNLPPGRYQLVSWHPRLPGTQQLISLAPNEAASCSISVGVNSLPKVAK